MYSPILQLIIGTLLGIGFLTVSAFIIAVCFFWLLAWTLPVAWRVWSLWKAFSAYRRGESVMLSAVSAISPRAAFWLPRLSAVIFHLLGRPAPPNWRAQTPPSFAEAAHVAQHESVQREGVPNAGWIRQAERDRMMATRNEGYPSNVSYAAVPPPGPSAEAAEGGWMAEAAISAIQFIQNAAQQLMEKLKDYTPNAQQQFGQHRQYAQQSFDTPNRRPSEASSVAAPSSSQDSVMGGVKRRHPYPEFHEDPDSSNYYTTPQPSAPSN